MKTSKSTSPTSSLIKYPFLKKYAQNGLVNFNALARLTNPKGNLAAVGMELRRQISKSPKQSIVPPDFSKYSLQLVTRTNVHEIILTKNAANRDNCLKIVNQISQTKNFVSIVEGEKEIVVMTDHPLAPLVASLKGKHLLNHQTSDLGFISINFPIEMREIVGVYSLITSALSDVQIPIHSFHTIGGEILILVKNEDLLKTQAVLQSVLFN